MVLNLWLPPLWGRMPVTRVSCCCLLMYLRELPSSSLLSSLLFFLHFLFFFLSPGVSLYCPDVNLPCSCLLLLSVGVVGLYHHTKCAFPPSLRVSGFKMESRVRPQKVRALQKPLSPGDGRVNTRCTLYYILPFPPLPYFLHFQFLLPPLLPSLPSFSFFVTFTEYLRGGSKNWNYMGRGGYV